MKGVSANTALALRCCSGNNASYTPNSKLQRRIYIMSQKVDHKLMAITLSKPNRFSKQNSCPILCPLSTKVRKIFEQCRRPLVLFKALARLSISCFVQKIFAVMPQSRRKTEQMYKVLASNFWKGRPRLFYSGLLARFPVHRLAYSLVEFRLLISVC